MANILDFHIHYNGDASRVGQFVERWKEAGVSKACVFANNAGDGSHCSIPDIISLAQRFPDFFIPFGYVNLGHEDGIAVVREAAAAGCKGIKFIYPAKPYDDDEYFPLYEEVARAGLTCLFHTGVVVGTTKKEGSLFSVDFQRKWRVSSNYMRPATLDRIARVFPEMFIVGAHLGGNAWYEEAAQVMRWNANVHFDMAIGQFHYVRKDVPEGQEPRTIKPRIRDLRDSGILDLTRIIFGTDAVADNPKASPTWALRTLQFELDALNASDAERQSVRWGAAARILKLA